MIKKQSVLTPVGLSALLLSFYYLLMPWHQALVLDYAAVAQGAWWQPLTSQLMHHDQAHLWFNLAGLWIAWLLFPDQLQRNRDWWPVLPLLIAVSAGQFWLAEPTAIYAGFSGTLYGLFAWAALTDSLLIKNASKHWISVIILFGILLKTGLDFAIPSFAEGIAIYAHLSGVICGMLLAILGCAMRKFHVQSAA